MAEGSPEGGAVTNRLLHKRREFVAARRQTRRSRAISRMAVCSSGFCSGNGCHSGRV